ncbi:MAG: hypothetical protein WAM11_01315, partial [Cyanobium sp.]
MKADHSSAGFVVFLGWRTAVKFAPLLLSDRNSHSKFASMTQGTVLRLMVQIPASASAVVAKQPALALALTAGLFRL